MEDEDRWDSEAVCAAFHDYTIRLAHLMTRVAHCHVCDWVDGDPYMFICPNGHPMRVCTMSVYSLRHAVAMFN